MQNDKFWLPQNNFLNELASLIKIQKNVKANFSLTHT